MARYTCSFIVAVPLERLQQVLIEVLESCNFDIIYNTGDYLMAREIPGHVSFAKLVTVEVLIDKSTATDREVRMNFVVKNEELPLQVDNHCHQMFYQVHQAIAENRHWQLVESVAG
ncbi:hypothetical protein H6F78_18545 [Coleofasciculus sp. FACHB-64]|jgi:predicted MPP superfamily phosphohydrolase|uniref:hypothetical protein n=1 Tax=Cyanophyceae TaxID=3028117 RepID=UPI0016838937|nr:MULTISPECIES: hypothetical protein [unclassified Coleofasciculus]MBD1839129.1 hypothetical protein [Coleofasciculus sp. FACHB-501]MBD1879991.1 hypothetical protein [Coleofasciculus sp. FACHB-T130]MBD1888020.1 hypothetical protein [Coleofasciculus sp. FACHB-SPT9]MBD1894255.1 hypothetical protein [Coleofasciculus sp. FACHB-129]MBD1902004.1 hypothetical protein [Coleofasciculus sp. FACHB-125]